MSGSEEAWLVPGTVIKIYTYNTNPPKYKRCVIVGINRFSTMIGLIFFNSNPPSSPFLEPYQVAFDGSQDYLDHDCYLDCAQLIEETKGWITNEILTNENSGVLGNISDEDWTKIISIVKNARTISYKIKTKYGLQ